MGSEARAEGERASGMMWPQYQVESGRLDEGWTGCRGRSASPHSSSTCCDFFQRSHARRVARRSSPPVYRKRWADGGCERRRGAFYTAGTRRVDILVWEESKGMRRLRCSRQARAEHGLRTTGLTDGSDGHTRAKWCASAGLKGPILKKPWA